MPTLATVIRSLPWADISAQLDSEGYAVLPGLLSQAEAHDLASSTSAAKTSRRESLALSELGRGELAYFGENPQVPWAAWRTNFYRPLAGIANGWNDALGVGYRYPAELHEFLDRCKRDGQTRPLSHMTWLAQDDYIGLHQRDDGEHVFPLQVVALLSEPAKDFGGGEFVMTEQRPRMQSRPMVLPLALGDAAIISTAVRPFKGSKGYYRVNLKHAISRVRHGSRIGVELSFHNGR